MDPAFMLGHLDPANRFTMEGLNMAFAAELQNTKVDQAHKSSLFRPFIDC